MHVKNTKPFIPQEDINPILTDIEEALGKGNLTFGTDEFEKEFAQYSGTKYAVAVNSGTSALEAPLRYFGVKNKEVIVPTNTFVASANAVVFAGGTPVMVDMDESNLCADFEDIKKKVTKNTAGIIIVHSCGYMPPYMFKLRKFCDDNGLFLLVSINTIWSSSSHNSYGAIILSLILLIIFVCPFCLPFAIIFNCFLVILLNNNVY